MIFVFGSNLAGRHGKGAALAAVLSLLGVSAALSAVVFVVASGIVVAMLLPVAHRHRRLPPQPIVKDARQCLARRCRQVLQVFDHQQITGAGALGQGPVGVLAGGRHPPPRHRPLATARVSRGCAGRLISPDHCVGVS